MLTSLSESSRPDLQVTRHDRAMFEGDMLRQLTWRISHSCWGFIYIYMYTYSIMMLMATREVWCEFYSEGNWVCDDIR